MRLQSMLGSGFAPAPKPGGTNNHNPDPKVDVRWGDQTWEEMQGTGIPFRPVAQRLPAAAGVRT